MCHVIVPSVLRRINSEEAAGLFLGACMYWWMVDKHGLAKKTLIIQSSTVNLICFLLKHNATLSPNE